MTNLWLFVLTLVAYVLVGACWYEWFEGGSFYRDVIVNVRTFLKRFTLFALLCLPININDRVFTVFGNAEGKNGVFSVLSFYQKSECGDTFSLFNIFGYQKAKQVAGVVIGIPAYQRGENSVLSLGVSAYQVSDDTCFVLFGVSGYQTGKQHILNLITLTGYQKAEAIGNLFGIVGYQRADKKTYHGAGLVGYQKSGAIAGIYAGMCGYQRVANKQGQFLDKSFAVWSELQAPEDSQPEDSQGE